MRPRPYLVILGLAVCLVSSCGDKGGNRPAMHPSDLGSVRWDDILKQARGTEVNFAMWTGDDTRNRYFRNEVRKKLQDRLGISLRIVPLNDTVEAVNKLLNERGANKNSGGSIDFVWINGENFRTAKQGRILWGPFADFLPNTRLYDDTARLQDCGTSIDGFEAPWEKAQFVMAYDSARVPHPPDSMGALREWIEAHPGRFTYIAPPDFTGSAFIRHVLIHLGNRDPRFWTGFSEDLYAHASAKTIDYLNEIKPFLWRKGESYPPTLKELNRLFANNEVDFAMSYGPNFASTAILQGQMPPTTRTFVFKEATLGNFSFLAIPYNAANVPGALAAINELMSFEQMLEYAKVLDTPYPHRLDRLTKEQRAAVEAIPRFDATLPLSELEAHYLPEADAEYLNRLEKDWAAKVLRK